MASDSVSESLCIGDIIIKIANYFRIHLNHVASIPPSFLDENLLKNSRQFKKVGELWVWKDKEGEEIDEDLAQDLEYIEKIKNLGFEGVDLREETTQEQVPSQTQAPPQRKRARGPSSS